MTSARAESKVADLQVQIDVPPTWDPFLEDDIGEAFASILAQRFRQMGYAGVIDYVQAPRAPNPDLPLLSLRLIEWRINRAGNGECTFAAALRPASTAKEINLGLVSNSEFTWIRERGRFGLARARDIANSLEDTAQGAMRELYTRVAETRSVPGLLKQRR